MKLTLFEWIISVMCAVIIAFLLSFYMQKFYAMEELENRIQKTHTQRL